MKRILFCLWLLPQLLTAQPLPGIAEKTQHFQKFEGYLNYYWDDSTGKLWLEIDKLDTEMLYALSLPYGLGSNDIGLDRGLTGGGRVVKFERLGRRILLLEPNYKYRALEGDAAEKKAVTQSFAQSVLWGFDIAAQTGTHYLVDATAFLLRDAMGIASKLKKDKQGQYKTDAGRSGVYLANSRNFPLNTELESLITFVNDDGVTGPLVQSVAASAEAITLHLHHSFVQLPDNNYQPRIFDPRSSYIPQSFFDYSSPVSEPIRKYYIIRHRLQKKDPSAAISEPVKPIIYYLDNATPEPVRSALLEGASWWNKAFEAAGFRNAFQVKILPDSVDPMDIRYNVINWVHRSTRGWSYGASVVDPRTGEIIKGQVSLGSLRVRQDYLIATGLLAPFSKEAPAEDAMLQLSLARLRQLAAHEVGHTLGLMHNYAASADGRASVMDYPSPLVQLDSNGLIDLSDAYATGIGEWDKVSIDWGYRDFGPGKEDTAALNRILTRAEEGGLHFISDRDARAPGGLHPHAHLWDNGADPVRELKTVMQVRNRALSDFGENDIRPGMPMAMLEDVLVPVYFYHRYQLEAVIKEIGGMNYSYALRGDGQTVTAPLDHQTQLNALNAVIGCLDPAVLALPARIVQLIPPRPAGYDFSPELFNKRTGLAFDALSPAEAAVDFPFSLLFNPERLSRLAIPETNAGLGIGEMLDRLVDKTWKAPRRKGMEGLIQNQTEQVMLSYLLSASVDPRISFAARSALRLSVEKLQAFISQQLKQAKDPDYRGHLLLAQQRMKEPAKVKTDDLKDMPPGAPIGEDIFY